MRSPKWAVLLVALATLAVAACTQATPTPPPTATPTHTPTATPLNPREQAIAIALAEVPFLLPEGATAEAREDDGAWTVTLEIPGRASYGAIVLRVDLQDGKVLERAVVLGRAPLAPVRPDPLPLDVLPATLVETPIMGFPAGRGDLQAAIPSPVNDLRGLQWPEPNTFFGRVWVDGAPAPDGTVIEAVVEDHVCDRRETVAGQYRVTIVEGYCGRSGDTVRFRVAGRWADQKGRLMHPLMGWYLDLTVGPRPANPSVTPTPLKSRE